VNFPKQKPIYTYPRAMVPSGDLQVRANVKEDLVAELREQVARAGIAADRARRAVERQGEVLHLHFESGGTPLRARRVLIAIGRSGEYRMLGVPGEDLDKVYNRLHDPADFEGMDTLVVGAGTRHSRPRSRWPGPVPGSRSPIGGRNSRGRSRRTWPGPAPRIGRRFDPSHGITRARDPAARGGAVDGHEDTIPNDVVFTMIGREAPLDFLRRSGLRISGEMRARQWAALSLFLLFCCWLYNWKSGGAMSALWAANTGSRSTCPTSCIGSAAPSRRTRGGLDLDRTIAISASGPAFWYTLVYSTVIVIFGWKRIRRRRTPTSRCRPSRSCWSR